MAVNYAYAFAEIDPATNMCIQVIDTTDPGYREEENWVELEVCDPEYLFKYYINGSWYEDEAGTIPWTSSLL